MIRLLALACAIAALSASTALAQSTNPATPAPGNPAAMPPGTPETAPGTPAQHQTNVPDRIFVHEAAIGGMAEVEAAKLAEQASKSEAVKQFARRMLADHQTANDKLASLAKGNGLPMPANLDNEHHTLLAQLRNLTGARFDKAYLMGQMIDHQKTAQLLEYEIGSGENAQLKSFASDVLPKVLDHLRMAQTITAEMTGEAQEMPPEPPPAK